MFIKPITVLTNSTLFFTENFVSKRSIHVIPNFFSSALKVLVQTLFKILILLLKLFISLKIFSIFRILWTKSSECVVFVGLVNGRGVHNRGLLLGSLHHRGVHVSGVHFSHPSLFYNQCRYEVVTVRLKIVIITNPFSYYISYNLPTPYPTSFKPLVMATYIPLPSLLVFFVSVRHKKDLPILDIKG
jgi:hypothetical protein